MIVNKKFDRLKQWGRERMGSEVKTDTSDEFKALQMEMQLRHDGMERLDRSAKGYMKAISTRSAGEEKEKVLPVAYFGSAMIAHGDDFEPDSEFGQCLSSLGRANERIGRMQETYSVNATSTWLESVERSLVQMKEYQSAKKKLESRRLAYDTAQQKMQKTKKEDFRMEEELRSQKAKFEESSEDVYRRMLDIKEAEADSVADLSSFLEAELSYYDRCREVLLQLKRDWPAQVQPSNRSDTASPVNGIARRGTRSRASSMTQRFAGIAEDEPLEPPSRPTISSRVPSGQNSPRRETPGFDFPIRPAAQRAASGFEGPTSISRNESPAGMPRLSRVPTDPIALMAAATGGRDGLRVSKRDSQIGNVFGDDQSDYSTEPSSAFDRLQHSRTSSFSQQDGGRKAPPPPPPSRSKKPPPPPPLKRSALSTSEIPHY
ncbi:hypothetical protein LTR78_003604 [Recurvomyces mirabilis]|uniref:BAR domain-containing protein n=1 Tax=Recurvomyces mirabilis TaxID=574656 RepID=A0AAE0WR88_9PEZI|nr:hypothetical protein LTR78_003604 [Recurvomyces mirabilis]KAK5154719.1 hypothetical protein LTS14_006298 [Recurvomyces mirabilis]